MGKPSKDPGNNENEKFGFSETLKYSFKLSVLGQDQVKDNVAHYDSDVANIEFEEVVEVDFAGLFHHVVPDVIAENGQKDRGDIMEALDVPEIWMMSEEVVQDHEDIILSFFP